MLRTRLLFALRAYGADLAKVETFLILGQSCELEKSKFSVRSRIIFDHDLLILAHRHPCHRPATGNDSNRASMPYDIMPRQDRAGPWDYAWAHSR